MYLERDQHDVRLGRQREVRALAAERALVAREARAQRLRAVALWRKTRRTHAPTMAYRYIALYYITLHCIALHRITWTYVRAPGGKRTRQQ